MGFEKEMGMFRYGVINPLLHGNDGRSLKKRMKELSEKLWTLPDGRLRQFSWGTIEDWYYMYKRDGLSGLENQSRKNKGGFRNLDGNARIHIEKYVKEHPNLKTSVLIDLMKKEEIIKDGHPSDSTIYRYVRTIREIIPVRKLFKGKKIECYSNDAKKGKNGDLCALCSKRMNCRQRIRLMLMVQNDANDPIPAQLEINSNSFEPLKKMLEPLNEEELP